MSVVVRPATMADFLTVRGKPPPLRCRAWVGEVDGKVIALGGAIFGLHPQAAATMFLEGAPDARRYPVALHRAARRILSMLRSMGIGTLAVVVEHEHPRAEAWARRLGFAPEDDSGVWVCRA